MGPPQEMTWFGLDVGGSGFRLRRLVVRSRSPLELDLHEGDPAVDERWPARGFTPVALAEQRAELEAGRVRPRTREEREAAARTQLLATAIRSALRAVAAGPALVALAAPGIKTADERGIAVLRHGPRDVRFLERLRALLPPEVRLAERLVGDGLAAARGEQVARTGALVGIERGYYVGGGTGLAEALVLDGVARGLDTLDPPLPRAFELRAPGTARSQEDELAPAALLARLRGGEPPDGQGLESLTGCAEAPAGYAEALAGLVRARVQALAAHPEGRGAPLQRVVLGQAFAFLPEAYRRALSELALGVELVLSPLRAAPALGALALTLEAHDQTAWTSC